MGRITNAVICAARACWYRIAEREDLRWSRRLSGWAYENWGFGEDPLVSVYVPTHNRADLLIERSLKSISAQTYKNLEIIVVADNCNDATTAKVLAYKHVIDPRVRLVFNDRPKSFPHKAENYWFAGRADPSNVGLAECKGAWIATNDDDDEWTPDHIEKLLRYAQQGNYEFVSAYHDTPKVKDARAPVKPYVVDGVWIGGVQTWLYRAYLKSFKFNRQCWRKRWNRVCDTDLQDRFVKAGVRMGFFPDVVTHVDPRPGETKVGLKAYTADPAKTERHFAS